MSTDTQDSREVVEIGAKAMEDFRWDARKANDALLAKNGLWPDRSYQPSDAAYVRAILTAIEASGWKIVPVEPTEEMLEAGGSSIIRPSIYMGGTPPGAKRRARDVWADMLSASPKVTR